MTDEDDRCVALLGKLQDGGRTFTYLHQASRRRVDVFRKDGLDGVDDDQVGAGVLDVDVDLLQGCLAHDEAIGCLIGDAVGPQFQLAGTFFARHIKHLLVVQFQHRLEDEGGFPDARFST